MAAKARVPVTVVTGALGSGKTTLLNFILRENHGKRIAVIENEFGEDIGVENLIAKDGANGKMFDDFFELSNGCICCSVKDDLVSTLDRLLERRDKFDYILVETSGMADPGPVASVFWVDEELESHVYLDGIITVVDGKNFLRRLDDPRRQADALNEVYRQVAYADCILLNKEDLLDSVDEKSNVLQRVKEVNANARVIWTTRSEVDLQDILDVQSFEFSRLDLLRIDEKGFIPPNTSDSAICCSQCTSSSSERTQEAKEHHHHDIAISTLTLKKDGVMSFERLNRWLGRILWEDIEVDTEEDKCQEIFRMKGFVLAVAEEDDSKAGPTRHILQAVHELFELRPCDSKATSDSGYPANQLVVIGRNLSLSRLEDGFVACMI